VCEQVEPQLIFPSPEDTVPNDPEPVPFLLTESEREVALKVAVTTVLEFIVTVQVPVPEQPPPDHPAKVEPDEGEAERIIVEPAALPCVHVDPQFIIPGDPLTVPEPEPFFETVRL
jgi:hypothetical protein